VGEEPWDAGLGPDDGGLKNSVEIKTAAFLESIRTKNLLNEVAGGVESTLTAILGRTAAYEARERTWEEVTGSHAKWKDKVDIASLATAGSNS